MFGPEFVYNHIEKPMIPLMANVMERGVPVNLEKLRELHSDLDKELAQRRKVWADVSGGVNPDSPQQKSKFFGGLGLPLEKKTDSGLWSTDKEALEDLPQTVEVVALRSIGEVKNLRNLARGYLEAVRPDGRIYAEINPIGADATGRMSCFEPNLQQVPKSQGEEESLRYQWGKRMRMVFEAPDGYVWMRDDYNGMEMRCATNLSGDEIFTKIFRDFDSGASKTDPHDDTEDRIFHTYKVYRRESKVINFGMLYQEGAQKLAKQTGQSVQWAKQAISRYYLEHQGLKNWQDQTIEKAKHRGYAETYYGRRRHVRQWRESTPREMVNMPVQGTCGDILKLASIRMTREPVPGLERIMFADMIILFVHDELAFLVPEHLDMQKVMGACKYIMENIVRMPVVFRADAGYGKSWGEAD